MIDLLVFEESLPRLTDALAHDDRVRVICWHADGRCSLGGRTVKPDAIKPEVGWISFDILAHGEMKHGNSDLALNVCPLTSYLIERVYFRCIIACLISPIALAGFKFLGQVFVQFMIV